ARYDDVLRIETRIVEMTPVRIRFAYRCVREATDSRPEELAAEGTTTLASIGRDGRPRRLPEDVYAALSKGIESAGSSS
ncbi:MAG TPA: acyl-CoA thioesterase, partial [Planctomycetota bacterium]|nr:acyl-CoA thioesterase [Planctomycetota bacterium]